MHHKLDYRRFASVVAGRNLDNLLAGEGIDLGICLEGLLDKPGLPVGLLHGREVFSVLYLDTVVSISK